MRPVRHSHDGAIDKKALASLGIMFITTAWAHVSHVPGMGVGLASSGQVSCVGLSKLCCPYMSHQPEGVSAPASTSPLAYFACVGRLMGLRW